MHNSNAAKYLDILNSFDLLQSVSEPIHNTGHTHDLVITRPSDNLIDNPIVKDMQVRPLLGTLLHTGSKAKDI